MSQASEPKPSRLARSRRWTVLCAGGISAATLVTFFLADSSTPARDAGWQWLVSPATVSVLLSGTAIALGRRQLLTAFGRPLTGLAAGFAAGALGGCINAAIEWSWAIGGRATPTLYATMAALPVGAALGTAIGLIRSRAVMSATMLGA